MSFNVQFYSFAKEVNSSELPSGNGTTIPCEANDGVDIINPVIVLQRGNGGVNSPTAWNYCKIPEFNNRFYFIENWEWRAGLWRAHCAVDVLATYRTQIYNMSAYVVRSAHSYDGTISDALYLGRELFQQYTLSYPAPWAGFIYQGSVVIGVAGSGPTHYYKFNYSSFKNFLANLLSDNYVSDVIGTWQLSAFSEAKSIVDPLQYITSVIYIPLSRTIGNPVSELVVGFGKVGQYLPGFDWECEPIPLGSTSTTIESVMITGIPTHPWDSERGEYLNHAPWTSYTLDVTPFGSIEIDPSSFRGAIKLVYHIDWLTGAVILRIWGEHRVNNNWEDLIEMNVLKGQLGVNIEIGQVIKEGLGILSNVQHGANLVSQIMGGITGGGGTGGMLDNLITGGLSGAIRAAGSIVGGVASGVSGGSGWIRDSIESKIPHLNSVGSTGTFIELISVIWLNVKCIYPMFENREQRGRPLCKTMRLGDLASDVVGADGQYHSGYVMIADPDVKNISATASERILIVNFMTGGFYLA